MVKTLCPFEADTMFLYNILPFKLAVVDIDIQNVKMFKMYKSKNIIVSDAVFIFSIYFTCILC